MIKLIEHFKILDILNKDDELYKNDDYSTANKYFHRKTIKYEFTDYLYKIQDVLKFAMEMNDNGIHFPIWGICSGH